MPIVKASQNLVAITCISCLPINRQKCGAERQPMGVTETALRTNDISWCWLNSCSFIFHRTKEDEGMWPEQHESTCDGGVTGEGVRREQRTVGSRRVKYVEKLTGGIHELCPACTAFSRPTIDFTYRYVRRGLRCAHFASRTEVCALTLRIPPSNVSSTTTHFDGSLQDVSWFQQ